MYNILPFLEYLIEVYATDTFSKAAEDVLTPFDWIKVLGCSNLHRTRFATIFDDCAVRGDQRCTVLNSTMVQNSINDDGTESSDGLF